MLLLKFLSYGIAWLLGTLTTIIGILIYDYVCFKRESKELETETEREMK